MVLGVLVATAILGGGAGWFLSRRAHAQSLKGKQQATTNAQVKSPEEEKVKAAVHLDSFVVNLADPDESAFLRVGIDLGIGKIPADAQAGTKDSPLTPRIRDAILGVLSTWRSDELLGPNGRQKLKEQLLAALRARVPEMDIQEVYFTEFLVQR